MRGREINRGAKTTTHLIRERNAGGEIPMEKPMHDVHYSVTCYRAFGEYIVTRRSIWMALDFLLADLFGIGAWL